MLIFAACCYAGFRRWHWSYAVAMGLAGGTIVVLMMMAKLNQWRAPTMTAEVLGAVLETYAHNILICLAGYGLGRIVSRVIARPSPPPPAA